MILKLKRLDQLLVWLPRFSNDFVIDELCKLMGDYRRRNGEYDTGVVLKTVLWILEPLDEFLRAIGFSAHLHAWLQAWCDFANCCVYHYSRAPRVVYDPSNYSTLVFDHCGTIFTFPLRVGFQSLFLIVRWFCFQRR
jgi:hypothetical protein